jgi:ABC-type nickel/cobalt efflux system permease component RcnA
MIFLLLIAFGVACWLAWFWLKTWVWMPHVETREKRRHAEWRKQHPAEAAIEDAAHRRYLAAHAVEHQTEYLRVIAGTPFPPRTV